ncbi:hypothetical protein TNCV_3011901 [Trichonephila clavipes]|nr:hypothetical protein TNCV_3011901 [Trichonephila clavipes]
MQDLLLASCGERSLSVHAYNMGAGRHFVVAMSKSHQNYAKCAPGPTVGQFAHKLVVTALARYKESRICRRTFLISLNRPTARKNFAPKTHLQEN